MDYVVIVDKKNRVLETAPKLETHNKNTPLHRGFSLFLFNKKGELLLQQRSFKKKTWPLVWSNSCCGHPMLDESSIEAAKRRLDYELGISDADIFETISDFKYRIELNGIVENEICPILIGFTKKKPTVNKNEVNDVKWVYWNKFTEEVKNNPDKYSPWSVLEVNQLKNNKKFLSLYKKFIS